MLNKCLEVSFTKARTFGGSNLAAADAVVLEPAVVFRYEVGGGLVDGAVQRAPAPVLLSETQEKK